MVVERLYLPDTPGTNLIYEGGQIPRRNEVPRMSKTIMPDLAKMAEHLIKTLNRHDDVLPRSILISR